MFKKSFLKIIFLIVTSVAFFSNCANPITPDIINLNKDTILPVITITSPTEGSAYGKTIKVTGYVSDLTGTQTATTGIVSSIYYSVAAAGISETEVEQDADTFSFEFTHPTLSGTIIIKISATDANGNVAVKNLTLIDAGNDIPLFKAVPGNEIIELSWPEVPGKDNVYTIFYTIDGTTPSANYNHGLINITSDPSEEGIYKHTIDTHQSRHLVNGNRYCFLLKAESSATGNSIVNLSGVEEAVPLSKLTLSPIVSAVSSGVQIEWNKITGSDSFNIYRKAGGSSEETRIAYNYIGNSMVDQSVSNGIFYSYSVEPAMDNPVRSGNACCLASTQERSPEVSGFKKTPGDSLAVAVSGEYAFIADGKDDLSGTALLSVYRLNDGDEPTFITEVLMPVPPGNFSPNYSAEDIIVSENKAYIRVRSWNAGYRVNLWSVDISAPTFPSTIDTWIPPISGFSSQQYMTHYKEDGTDYIYFAKNAATPALYKIATTDGTLSGEQTYTGPGGSFNHIQVAGDYLVSYMMGGDNDKNTVMIPHNSITAGTIDGMLSRLETIGESSTYRPTHYVGDSRYLYTCYYTGDKPELSNLSCFDYSGGSLTEVAVKRFGAISADISIFWNNPSGYENRIMIDGEVKAMSLTGNKCALLYKKTSTNGILKVWDFSNHTRPEESCSFEVNTSPKDAFSNSSTIVASGAHGIQEYYLGNEASLSVAAVVDNIVGTNIVNVPAGLFLVTIGEDSPSATEKSFLSTMINYNNNITAGTMRKTSLTPIPENYLRDIAVQSSYIFAAQSDDGIYIIDMSNPDTPVQAGHIRSAVNVSEVEIRGSYLFAAESSMVRVYDISNLSTPVEVSSFAMSDYVTDMLLVEDMLYITSLNDDKIEIWNVSNPNQPVKYRSQNLPFSVSSICMSGTKLCMLSGEIISSGEPLNALFSILETNESNGYPYIVYTEFTKEGTDPDPIIAKKFIMNTSYVNRKIAAAGDFLFISGRSSVIVYNIHDIARPYLIGGETTYNSVKDSGYYPQIHPVGDKLFIPFFSYLHVFNY